MTTTETSTETLIHNLDALITFERANPGSQYRDSASDPFKFADTEGNLERERHRVRVVNTRSGSTWGAQDWVTFPVRVTETAAGLPAAPPAPEAATFATLEALQQFEAEHPGSIYVDAEDRRVRKALETDELGGRTLGNAVMYLRPSGTAVARNYTWLELPVRVERVGTGEAPAAAMTHTSDGLHELPSYAVVTSTEDRTGWAIGSGGSLFVRYESAPADGDWNFSSSYPDPNGGTWHETRRTAEGIRQAWSSSDLLAEWGTAEQWAASRAAHPIPGAEPVAVDASMRNSAGVVLDKAVGPVEWNEERTAWWLTERWQDARRVRDNDSPAAADAFATRLLPSYEHGSSGSYDNRCRAAGPQEAWIIQQFPSDGCRLRRGHDGPHASIWTDFAGGDNFHAFAEWGMPVGGVAAPAPAATTGVMLRVDNYMGRNPLHLYVPGDGTPASYLNHNSHWYQFSSNVSTLENVTSSFPSATEVTTTAEELDKGLPVGYVGVRGAAPTPAAPAPVAAGMAGFDPSQHVTHEAVIEAFKRRAMSDLGSTAMRDVVSALRDLGIPVPEDLAVTKYRTSITFTVPIEFNVDESEMGSGVSSSYVLERLPDVERVKSALARLVNIKGSTELGSLPGARVITDQIHAEVSHPYRNS